MPDVSSAAGPMSQVVATIPCRYDDFETAQRLRCMLIDGGCAEAMLTTKAGLGPAYLSMWHDADRRFPQAYVMHVDVGSHPRDSWLRVLYQARAERADIIIGSRFCPGGLHLYNWRRKWTSRAASAALSTITGTDYTDWTSGLRAYSPKARSVLANHRFQTEGHAWQIEALWVAHQEGLKIVEVPIDYHAGNSSLSWARVKEALKLFRQMYREQ